MVIVVLFKGFITNTTRVTLKGQLKGQLNNDKI